MAARASADQVQSDMRPANFRGAVQRLRTIKPKKERISAINGEIGGIYDTVEGFKVNKKAARIFLVLDKLEPDEQQDIWRSLMGLIDVAEWQGGDLVDQAEGAAPGNVVTPNFGRRDKVDARENAAGEDAGLAAEMEAIEQMPAETASGQPEGEPTPAPEKTAKVKRLSPAEAKKRAQSHFADGKAPPTGNEAGPEIYTGDNTDLAGE